MSKSKKELFSIVVGLLVLTGCSHRKVEGTIFKISGKAFSEMKVNDTAVLINQMRNPWYEFTLEENYRLEENAFTLTIEPTNNNLGRTKRILNLPSGKSRIDCVSDRYLVMGYFCGGPCSAKQFIFLDENRPEETYAYCHTVYGYANLITYHANEEFEELIIHNLHNSREVKVNIGDCAELVDFPCIVDSLYVKNNQVVIEYDTQSGVRNKKNVSLNKLQ